MPNYLTWAIIDTLSSIRYLNHPKRSERPQLLNDLNRLDRPVVFSYSKPLATFLEQKRSTKFRQILGAQIESHVLPITKLAALHLA